MNNKKKIVIFSLTPLGIGGMEENILQLAEGLSQQFEVIILGLFNDSFLIQAKLRVPQIQLIQTERPSKYNLYYGLKLIKLFKNIKPDLVHFQDPRSRLIGSPITKLLKIKSVYTFHMSPLFSINFYPKIWIYKIIEKIYNKNFTDGLIFVSKNVRDYYYNLNLLRKNRPNDYVVLNGIDVSPFLPLLEHKEAIRVSIRAWINVPADTKLILAVGRLTKQKGLDVLVHALSDLNVEALPPFKVLVAGDGEELHPLQNLATILGVQNRIHWLGFLHKERVREVLIASDLFVLPSRYECYPYSILEANAAQIPVLVTDVGGSAEAASLNTDNMVIPPLNKSALAKAITDLISRTPKTQIPVKSSLEDMLIETEAVLKKVLLSS